MAAGLQCGKLQVVAAIAGVARLQVVGAIAGGELQVVGAIAGWQAVRRSVDPAEPQARVQVDVECSRPQWSTSVTVRRFAEPSAADIGVAGPLA